MAGRLTDLIEIPDAFWARPETIDALRHRDIGRLFRLLSQHTGASQTRLAIACDMTQPKISGIMRGVARVETLEVFERIADGLSMPGPARVGLGLAPKADQAGTPLTAAGPRGRPGGYIPPGDARAALPVSAVPDKFFSTGSADMEEEVDLEVDPVRRRTFVALTGASLVGAILADTSHGLSDDVESLASSLAAYWPRAETPADEPPPGVSALAEAVSQAKRDYQACRYSKVTKDLPGLLTRLRAACVAFDGQLRSQACTLSAEAYHVAASILLKTGDYGLGWLAADRSMEAARASQDPVTVGSSARIVTHAMMSSGHLKAATSTASSMAAGLNLEMPRNDPEALSVYGSLLLRGAIAAAQNDDRHMAYDLLAEAEGTSTRVGEGQNLRWTAFSPANTRLHRLNLVGDLISTAQPSTRRHAEAFAQRIGITR
jgi:transcriptional regulator with XRE-family HTH domain